MVEFVRSPVEYQMAAIAWGELCKFRGSCVLCVPQMLFGKPSDP